MKIIVTVAIKEKGKLLMVQEAKEKCYGQWNFPAGHLDPNENIFEGAIREAKEETGYDVRLTSILSVQNYISLAGQLLRITFNAEIISGEIAYDKDEILDVKWISIEGLEQMGEELRAKDSILDIIQDVKENKQYSLDVIKNIF